MQICEKATLTPPSGKAQKNPPSKKNANIFQHLNDLLANCCDFANDHQPNDLNHSDHENFHTNKLHNTSRRPHAKKTPATSPLSKATKVAPSKQNENTYHHLNDLNLNDSDHEDSYPCVELIDIASRLKRSKRINLRVHSRSLFSARDLDIPSKENNMIRSYRTPPIEIRQFADATAKRLPTRPPETQPVNQPTSYRNIDDSQQPSVMDRMRSNAQQVAKQTAEKKQKSWEQRKSDTNQAPKKRVNAEDPFNLNKKRK